MPDLASVLTQRPIVIDGGLGSLLEQGGNDLGSHLWSARMLLEQPEVIRRAHRDYFESGAEVGIGASYQVSYEGLASVGIDRATTNDVLRRSVELVEQARHDAGVDGWVAASIGPYGAMLADGSEYRGDYGLTVAQLRDWHAERLAVLSDAGADLLAIETIPCLAEVEAVLTSVEGTGVPAWLAVTASMGALRSGESLADAFAIAHDIDEVIAVGINCSDPLDVASAIEAARSVTDKAIIVYPNSGEQWDAKNRRWMGHAGFPAALVSEWLSAGATLVGGCCRVGPAEIRSIVDLVR